MSEAQPVCGDALGASTGVSIGMSDEQQQLELRRLELQAQIESSRARSAEAALKLEQLKLSNDRGISGAPRVGRLHYCR